MSYQGYANYQTWVVSLWIANDEGLYTFWQEQKDADNLAELVQEWVEENAPELNGLYSDLLLNAVGMVEWNEVAENIKG